MFKTCNKCGKEKEIDEFHLDRKAKDGHHNECKECQRKYDATRKYDEYHNGGQKEKAYLARDCINWLAVEGGCVDCIEEHKGNPEKLKELFELWRQHPEILEFDHVPGRGEKKFKVSTWGGYVTTSPIEVQSKSVRRLQDELAKCDVVCTNHHTIRTRERSNGAYTALSRVLRRGFVWWRRARKGCRSCKEHFWYHPECLQHNHLDPSTKLFRLSRWWSNSTGNKDYHTLGAYFREEAKCEVLCGNCHVIETKRGWHSNGNRQVSIDQKAIEREKIINA